MPQKTLIPGAFNKDAQVRLDSGHLKVASSAYSTSLRLGLREHVLFHDMNMYHKLKKQNSVSCGIVVLAVTATGVEFEFGEQLLMSCCASHRVCSFVK